MKRLLAIVAAVLLLPASAALATDLDELLEESQGAAYSAEQLITCDTPDGVRDGLIEMEQRGGEIRYRNRGSGESDIWSGFGAWAGPAGGSRVSADDQGDPDRVANGTYQVSIGSHTEYLGRPATTYTLTDDGVVRAELVVDDAIGVFLRVVTLDSSGEPYCERRFVSFDPNPPDWSNTPDDDGEVMEPASSTALPATMGSFSLVDVFHDDSGLVFAYYSDGFFSFAVFRSPVPIEAAGATAYLVAGDTYRREFSPGQVTYTWPVSTGGMALIGDLPPDMHDVILAGLESPSTPGFFNRLWRSFFG